MEVLQQEGEELEILLGEGEGLEVLQEGEGLTVSERQPCQQFFHSSPE